MTFASAGQGPDGRPLIEITRASAHKDVLDLEGTACVYEGNVIVQVGDPTEGESEVSWVQATEGGPGRGDWETSVSLSNQVTTISIGGEDAESGGLLAQSVVVLRVNADQVIEGPA